MIVAIVVVHVIHLDVYNVIIPAHISRRTTIHKGIAVYVPKYREADSIKSCDCGLIYFNDYYFLPFSVDERILFC